MANSIKRVIALGFFDGVHLGHAALLRKVAQRSKELDAIPCAFTFDRSPTAALTGREVPLLTDIEDRIALMEGLYGIREVVVAPFETMRKMNWRDFVTDYLQKELGAVHVVAGHDFHFGYRGEGDPARLQALCRELGLGCDILSPVTHDGVTVSSTYIRTLIARGELSRAAAFLGHPHALTGQVIHGKGMGRTIGLPTANLALPEGLIVPALGVYAAKAKPLSPANSLTKPREEYPAVVNIGVRPTVDDGDAVTVEGYLLDFDGDLYGQALRVELYDYLRPERKFASLDDLRTEVLSNARQVRAYFTEK